MKKWLTRLVIVKIIISLALLGYWLISKSRAEGLQAKARQKELVSAERQEKERIYQFEERLAGAVTLEDFQLLEKALEQLPVKAKEKLKSHLELSLACYYFDRAEENIFRAKSILAVTGVEGSEGGRNPIAEKYISESFRYYRAAKKKIDALEKSASDSEYNFHFFYARGNIYFRYLSLIAEEGEMQDVFNQTVLAWREALVYREKDIDTEINLEILRKNQDQMMKNATGGSYERMKMLPQQGVGLGKPRGVH